MEERYLSWLLALRGVSPRLAERIAKRYPNLDRLRSAPIGDLNSIPGITPELARRILDAARDERVGEPRATLCPNCGADNSLGSKQCISCGHGFEGAGAPAPGNSIPPEGLLRARDGAVKICVTCGAYLASGTAACKICGARYSAEELASLPAVDTRPLESPVDATCPHCGAYLLDVSEACLICGRDPAPGPQTAVPKDRKRLGRDFLSRWRRATAEGPPGSDISGDFERRTVSSEGSVPGSRVAREPPLRPQSEQELRLPEEGATEAGEPVPTMSAGSDRAPVEGERPAERFQFPPPSGLADAATTREMIANLDRLLAIGGHQSVVWKMKGELLASLGLSAEAREGFEKARALAATEGGLARSAGLQTQAPHETRTGSSSKAGRTNGRINGLTNGRVNGLTNGRVNGLTNGRLSGAGRVNGILFPGHGRTNGLVNGDGFTNGRHGRIGGVPARGLSRTRSTVWIASIVLALVLVPVILSMLTMPPAQGGITIDGSFADWDQVPIRFDDRPSDQSRNPDANLLSYKVAAHGYRLSVYARVEGVAFRGIGNGSDLFVALIDADGRADTGYDVGTFGADYAVEVYGWDAEIRGALSLRFESANRRDWHGFRQVGAAMAAASGSDVEFALEIDDSTTAQILLIVGDGQGLRDTGDFVVRPGRDAIVVREVALAPAVIGSPAEGGIIRLDIRPAGPSVSIGGVNVTKRGSAPDTGVTLRLYRDNGDGQLGPADVLLGTTGLVQGLATFQTVVAVPSLTTLLVSAEFGALPPNTTFGLALEGFDAIATTAIEVRDPFLSYLATAPEPTADGAFGDWSTVPRSPDPIGDVASESGPKSVINGNIDLVGTGSHRAGNVSFYLEVDGTVLGGVDVPNLRGRVGNLGGLDSDLDAVPDNVELALGNPALRYDFDNDNVTDANEFRDIDSDGVIDYSAGPDVWLNTTIPDWYPPPFALRNVSRYIGPIATPVFEGVDNAIVYVDRDNTSATGLVTTLGASTYGFDWAIVVAGRHGTVVASDLFRFRSGAAVPWERLVSVPAATDAHRLEMSVPSMSLNLSPDYQSVYYATDWTTSFDVGLPVPPGRSFAASAGTRSPAGDNVVINEVSPQPNPEWIELANPTSNPISLLGWRLQRRLGGTWTTIFTFAFQVIGPWGSGSEYLAVNLPFNSLPNGQSTVRLVNRFGASIDLTDYQQMGQGRTWSRLKHPSTGKPMDSDNGADFYISVLPSPGGPNDRHRPRISAAKTADLSAVAPGDLISYSVFYNNTDTGYANHVWVNDTLPSQVTYIGSSVVPSGNAGQTYSWHFASVAPLTINALTITVQVNGGAGDGAVLVNRADLEYTDQLNRSLGPSSAWRNATVSRPVISVEKIASPSTAQAGDTVVYTIYYNNTGSASAAHVWVNDTLPADVTFLTSSVPPTGSSGQTYTWHFTSVAPGPHSFTITVIVNANATSPDLVNWVYLNYTTQNNYPLEGSQTSFIVPIPEFPALAIVASVPLIVMAIRRWRARPTTKKGTVADSVPGIGGR